MTNRRKRGHLGHPVLKRPDLYSTCCALARTRIGEESKTIKQTRSSFDKNIFSRTKPSGYTDSVFPPLERSLDDGTLFFCMKPILSCARIYLVIVGSASWEWKLRRSVFPPRIRGEWGMGNGDIWIQVCWKWIGFYFLDFFCFGNLLVLNFFVHFYIQLSSYRSISYISHGFLWELWFFVSRLPWIRYTAISDKPKLDIGG